MSPTGEGAAPQVEAGVVPPRVLRGERIMGDGEEAFPSLQECSQLSARWGPL